ncbi:hypothetical protein [Halarcobacter sp.]|uniref:hypothetical protein n=1 Tax=Halarcobacter sp. TaxID=2321133 RepID=UPI0029F4ED01|nr:hypothetical protein [Halarcobacter sp.]
MDKNINIKITTKADSKAINTVADRVKTLGNNSRTTANSVRGLDNSVGSFVKRNNSLKNTAKEFDNIGNSVRKTAKDFDNLDNKTKTSSSSMAGFSNTISSVQSKLVKFAAVAVPILAVAKASKELYIQGINYNKTAENLSSGLSTLAVVTSENIDSTGKYLSIQEKYALANREATKSIEELTKINASTPHTLDQTVEIYKAMYASMKNVGVSNKEMIDLTQKLSVTAGSAGVEFNQLLAGVDGLATGTVMSNSELGRLLGSLGLTNETLKKSSNIYETINSKLKDVQPLETYDTAVSNLSNNFNILAGASVEPFFDDVKKGINSTSSLLAKLTVQVNEFYDNFKDIDELTTINQLNKRVIDVYSQIEEKTKSLEETSLFEKMFGKGGDGKIKAEIRALNLELIALNKQYENTITKEETNKKRILVAKKNVNEVDTSAEIAKKIKQQEIAYNSFIQTTGTAYEKWLNSTNQKMVSLAQSGTLTAQQLQTAFDFMKNDFNGLNLADIETDIKQQIEAQKIAMENKIPVQQALLHLKNQELLMSGQITAKQYTENESKINNIKALTKELDNLKSFENGFNFEINFDVAGLDGTAKSIMSISDAFSQLGKNNKTWETYNDGLTAAQKNSKKYAKDQTKYFSNQIDGYSAMAGAAAGMFEEQSTGYKVLTALQVGLQIANQAVALSEMFKAEASTVAATAGVAASTANTSAKMTEAGANATVAVTNAGGGDPYTAIARVGAMIALMASVMTMFNGSSTAGGASGGGSISVSDIAQTQRKQMEADYKIVTDRLDRQISLLEAIEKNGSAAQLKIISSYVSFERDFKFAINDIFADSSELGGLMAELFQMVQPFYNRDEDFEPYDGLNIVRYLDDYQETVNNVATRFPYFGNQLQNFIDQFRNDLQNVVNEYAVTIVSSIQELSDQSEDLQDMYDSITGNMYYETQRLAEAYKEVDRLRGSSSLSSYITQNIEEIEKLRPMLTMNVNDLFRAGDLDLLIDEAYNATDVFSLLLSNNVEDMAAQIEVTKELGRLTNQTFSNGVADVIDYIEQIELVSDAMANSRKNTKTYQDDLKTDIQLARDLASAIDITYLAKDMEELNSLFIALKNSTYGLTDAGLELLQANKSLIEDYTDIIKEIDNITNPKTLTLDSITVKDASLDTAEDILEQLKEAKQAEIDRITEENNNRKTELQERQKQLQEEQKTAQNLVKAFENTTKSLNSTYRDIMGLTENADSFTVAEYNRLYKEIKDGIENKADVSSLTSDFSKYATSYAEYIKTDSKTAEEYERRLKTLANEVKDLAGKSESATLNDLNKSLESSTLVLNSIDSQIAALDENLQSSINSVNSTYIQQMQLLKSALENSFKNNTSSKPSSVSEAFKEVLGRTPDVNSSGYSYWKNALLNDPNITEDNLAVSIARGANNFKDISKSLSWLAANNVEYGKNLIDNRYADGSINNREANQLLDNYGIPDYDFDALWDLDYPTFKRLTASNIVPFADGGVVQGGRGGVIGHIGEKDYSELIIPLDGRDFFGLEELKDLIRGQNEVIQDNISRTTIINTTSYIKEEKAQKENDVLEKIVAELRRLNIISSKHAEATKKVLKTQKQNLLKDLQEGA